MDIIFATTNQRKIEDLNRIVKDNKLNLNILCLNDIDWDKGDIDETGNTLEGNSLIKAKAVHEFCNEKGLSYIILSDDAGLFVESLNGEPGVYTARYADDELNLNPNLPKYQCLYKLLRNLNGKLNRNAYYKCVTTCMFPNGSYFQEFGKTDGYISNEIIKPIKKPFFYSLFMVNGISFNDLEQDKLKQTYRYQALAKTLKKLNKSLLDISDEVKKSAEITDDFDFDENDLEQINVIAKTKNSHNK